LLLLISALRWEVSAAENDPGADRPKLDPRLHEFLIAKERHARALARQFKIQADPEMWAYFDAAIREDWTTVRRLFTELASRTRPSPDGRHDASVHNLVWPPLLEAQLGYECFTAMDIKFVVAFARGVIDSIPRDQIYLGGTDPGRGVITAFVKSHAEADPFFVLSQNPLADGLYLEFLRAIYGARLSLPSADDLEKAFAQYRAEAALRLDQGRLKPGEKVSRKDGRIEFGGTVSYMAVNAILARDIFERNPKREFYIEESFVMDWMYPHLTPHGLIMKINRKPPPEIGEVVLTKDREYWRKQTAAFVGDWLTEETPLKSVCEFVERVYRDGDLEGFKGDPLYVTSDRTQSPRLLFGKLRQAQANLYEWRLKQSAAPAQRQAMQRAAELAYKQLFVLCPDSSEYVRRFVVFLRDRGRRADARLVVATGLQMNAGSKRLSELEEELKEN